MLGDGWIWTQRATSLLVVSIVLVLLRVLVEHFARTVNRVGDAIDLLLVLLPPQAIVGAHLLSPLCLVVTWETAHGLRRWLTHFIAYHALSTIYQFRFALLSSLINGSLSKARRLCSSFRSQFLLVDARA